MDKNKFKKLILGFLPLVLLSGCKQDEELELGPIKTFKTESTTKKEEKIDTSIGTLEKPIKLNQEIIFANPLEYSNKLLKIKVKPIELSKISKNDLKAKEGQEEYKESIFSDNSEVEGVGSALPPDIYCKLKLEIEAIQTDGPLSFDPFNSIISTSTITDNKIDRDQNFDNIFVKPETIYVNEGDKKTITLYFNKGIDDLIYLKLPTERNLAIYYKTFDENDPKQNLHEKIPAENQDMYEEGTEATTGSSKTQ